MPAVFNDPDRCARCGDTDAQLRRLGIPADWEMFLRRETDLDYVSGPVDLRLCEACYPHMDQLKNSRHSVGEDVSTPEEARNEASAEVVAQLLDLHVEGIYHASGYD